MQTTDLGYDYLIKLIIIGDSGVGKSALVTRIADNQFCESYVSTIGVDFKIKTINIDGKIYKMQLWDTAGQERFRAIINSYYKGAHGVLMVYDITNYDSFNNIKLWLEEIKKYASENVNTFLIGTKNDLKHLRVVPVKDGETYANNLEIPFHEVSSKLGTQISDLLKTVCLKTVDRHIVAEKDRIGYMKISDHPIVKNDKCCVIV